MREDETSGNEGTEQGDQGSGEGSGEQGSGEQGSGSEGSEGGENA